MFKLRNIIQDILTIEYFEKGDLPCFPSNALNVLGLGSSSIIL